MPKNPFQATDIILKNGGVIETEGGTSIIEVDSSGTPSIKANIEDSLADGSIYVGSAAGVTSEVAMSGDVTIVNSGATTIGAGAVTEPKVADSNSAGGLFVGKTAIATYDFSVDGGTEGVITLARTATIPDNAIVTGIMYDVITTFTSSADAATIKVNLPTDGDLSTAVAISAAGDAWDAGAHSFQVLTPTPVKTTGARAIEITTAGGEDLTAGKAVFVLSYAVTE